MSHLERPSPYMGCVLLEVVMEEMTSLLEFSRHNDSNPRGRTVSQTSYISKHREPVICHIHRDTNTHVHSYIHRHRYSQYAYTCGCRDFSIHIHICAFMAHKEKTPLTYRSPSRPPKDPDSHKLWLNRVPDSL